MSNDAMTEQDRARLTALRKLIADTAREVSTTDLVPVVLDDETAEAIAAAVLDALGANEVHHLQWGVRFLDLGSDTFTDPGEGDEYERRDGAELVVRSFIEARLVAREVRYGPWVAVQTP